MFLVDGGREDPNTSINRPSSAFKWRFADGPMMDQR